MNRKANIINFINRGNEIFKEDKQLRETQRKRGFIDISGVGGTQEYEQWVSEIEMFSKRHLDSHPLQNSINTACFHRDSDGSFERIMGYLKALKSDDEIGLEPSKNENRVQVKKKEFIIRAQDIQLKFKNRPKTQFSYVETINGADYEQWKSELLLFINRNLKEHDLYDNVIQIIESYKTKSLIHLNDIIGVLNTIAIDVDFFEQNISNKTQEEGFIGMIKSNKIFIVHGHDDDIIVKTKEFIRKMGLEPIVLREQANMGRTIIEKIEHYTDVEFAIVLYTPCDKMNNGKFRARQNVVIEHGYLMSKLGRENVVPVVKGEVETPGDIAGVVYITMDNSKDWEFQLVKELQEAGYDYADANKI